MSQPRFELGQLVATPAALEALAAAGVSAASLIARHVAGDWGVVSFDDQVANERALVDGSRIFSAYQVTPDLRVWVITEAVGDNDHRESTCVLLPSDY